MIGFARQILRMAFFLSLVLVLGCASGSRLVGVSNPSPGTSGGPPPLPATDAGLAEHVPQQIVIGLLPQAEVRKIVAAVNGRVLQEFKELNAVLIELSRGDSIVEAIRKVQGMPGVKYAEPNYVYRAFVIPDDPFFASKQWGPQKIDAPAAWDTTTGNANSIVAVVDTGVSSTNAEFGGRILPGTNCLGGSSTEDDNGHGTHVAGIAAAGGNNGIGIAGLAWGARILPIKVLDSTGSGTSTSVSCGISFGTSFAVANPGMRVVENLSLGGAGYAQMMKDAVDAALQNNVMVVAAAGNDGKSTVLFPAGYSGVMAVGAITPTDERATFSTYGSQLSLVAPGVDIYSTILSGSYAFKSGTSMAAPHVTGVAALIWTLTPGLTPVQVRSQVEQTASDLGPPGFDPQFGWGLVSAAAAVEPPVPSNYGNIKVTACLNACPPSPGGSLAVGANIVIWGGTALCTGLSQVVQTALTNDSGEALFHAVTAGSYCATASTPPPRYIGQTATPFAVTAGATTSVSVVLAPF